MPLLDIRVPAVLLRIDRNPFHHGTLGAVRSLGRAGVEVHLVADCAASPVRGSRFLGRLHPPPAPGARPADVAAVLHRVAARIGRPAVLIAMDDAGAIAVSRLRERLAPAFLLPPGSGALAEEVADKAELAGLCARVGVPHPLTLVPDSAAEAVAGVERLGLPVVAKWSRPWLLPPGSGLRSTVVLRSAREARELYARAAEAGSRLLLQAFLPPGPDRDWFFHGYADRQGTLRAGGPGRKHRSWPRGAGLTAAGEWTVNPPVTALAERLVGALGYRGILDLDFRREARTGAYHLLDFNPRPGAQFRLFTDASGLDVVRALHLDLTDRALPAPAPRPGRGFVVENYAPLTALRRPPQGRELAWHAADDPGPGLAMWALWSRHVGGRVAERLAPRAMARARTAVRRGRASAARAARRGTRGTPAAMPRPGSPAEPADPAPAGPAPGGPGPVPAVPAPVSLSVPPAPPAPTAPAPTRPCFPAPTAPVSPTAPASPNDHDEKASSC
ncbi:MULTISPECIES: ATP-grasp domain-containing protein [Streptomyces]|uniref:Predicted ATP-dependent carboligase, ATP-grasp superfamily n=1 Tax=Streptomyces griseoaurantiacus TaxID=68213 RepID=A0A1G7BK44_9ACTN|nr:ATP-grasp domain-containing protein [Streptomyces jietaisiensis]SDE26655.1 Predicted ATP-dependent carboligase, ATP-grasp superfamily [Streptomyces jietaisiensis]